MVKIQADPMRMHRSAKEMLINVTTASRGSSIESLVTARM